MPPISDYAIVGGVAAVVTYLATFPIRKLAARWRFVALPDERRVHSQLIPYGGGIAMFVAFLGALGLASRLHPLRGLFQGSTTPSRSPRQPRWRARCWLR